MFTSLGFLLAKPSLKHDSTTDSSSNRSPFTVWDCAWNPKEKHQLVSISLGSGASVWDISMEPRQKRMILTPTGNEENQNASVVIALAWKVLWSTVYNIILN